MATNLRLAAAAAAAVRDEALRSGRSQQDVIRDAVDQHLRLADADRRPPLPRPAQPFRRATRLLRIDQSTAELLARGEQR